MSDHRAEVPAFPIVHPDGQGVQFYGMSLRDYFAAKAVNGLMSNEEAIQRFRSMSMTEGFESATLMATAAYQIADAMLAERTK